ncbi:MAG TPA: TlpA disulfide reductase family protein [Thermoanaerobaculia bacterium]|nr:TlpA disulfide reductase family protein [Thermoanaerobaculia bacterium]
MRRPWTIALLSILAAAAAASCSRSTPITSWGCSAPPEVEAAWRETDDVQDLCGRKASCWDEKVAATRSLRDRFPRELLAHRVLARYARMIPRDFPSRDALRSELEKAYGELARRYPKNPAYPYLLSQLERNRKKNRELLERSVALDPGFAWSHEALVRSLSWRPAEDKKSARAHLEAFARICPAKTGVLLSLLASFDDRPSWEAHAPSLRAATKPEADHPEDLKNLWELEFKYADPAQFGALREDVKRQVAALRKQDRTDDRQWLAALEDGYKLTEDADGTRWVEDTTLAKFPCEWTTTQIWLDRFQKEHGKFPDVEGEAQQTWLDDELAEMEPRLAQCPDESLLWQERLQGVAMSEASPPESVVAAGERVLAILGDVGAQPVARAWLDKGVALDRIGPLLDAAKRQIERDWQENLAYGIEGDDLREARFYHLYDVQNERVLRVRLALARKDSAAAAETLANLDAAVNDLEKAAEDPAEKSMSANPQAELWKLRAEADVLAGRNEEALAAYARSIEKSPDDRKVLEAAEKLYGRMHGGAGFDAWRRSAQQAAATASQEITRAVRRPLPDFTLTDIAGKKWTPAELRGKSVLLNFWATWCGPCRSELPHVQKLYERAKDRKDVAVVTVSLDDNPGLIEPMMREEKFTFPVLVAGAGSMTKWAPSGIPQNYIVDPGGTIVEEQLGFGGDGDVWLAKMEERLRNARAPAPSSK